MTVVVRQKFGIRGGAGFPQEAVGYRFREVQIL